MTRCAEHAGRICESRDTRSATAAGMSGTWIVRLQSRDGTPGRSTLARPTGMIPRIDEVPIGRAMVPVRPELRSAAMAIAARSRRIDDSVGVAERERRSSTMASRTRCRSVGDEAMTRSTSAVAVCCSSASVSSLLRCSSSSNSRAFSMAMTAWSANVSSSAICRSRERPHLDVADRRIAPIADALAEQRHDRSTDGRHPRSGCRLLWRYRELGHAAAP